MGPFLTTLASRYGFSSLRFRRITLFCILFLVAALFSQGAEAQEKITTVNNPALKRLLYQRQEYDGHGLRYSDIYVLELPSHKNRLFVKGGEDPAWSPHQTKVAYLQFLWEESVDNRLFHRERGLIKDRQIRVVNADGSDDRTLTSARFGIGGFAWSSVRDEIAYFENPKLDGHAMIVRINADGSERKEITSLLDMRCRNLADEDTPTWSPDGEKLAFTGCAEGRPVVVVIGRNGENPQAVGKGYGPLWSPDGKRLAFRHESEMSPTATSLWVANADGNEPHKILDGEGAQFGLAFSPDGKSIVFGSKRNNKHWSEIFRVNFDGSGLETVARRGGLKLSDPTFSPDGKVLILNSRVFPNDDGVWQVELLSRRLIRLTSGMYGGVVWDNR